MQRHVQLLTPAARSNRGLSLVGRSGGGLSPAGFSLVDMLVVVALIGIISAIALPNMLAAADSLRLGQEAREVERVMQTARQRAVASKRPIRVRFNCPSARWYRAVELLGTARAPLTADTSVDRCRQSTYPFPAADQNPATRPNLDGPANVLDPFVSFGTVRTVEFWADGTAHYDAGTGTPWAQIPTTGTTITLTRTTSAGTKTATITVNGLGKVQLLSIP
jgi:type II secretion system protein H